MQASEEIQEIADQVQFNLLYNKRQKLLLPKKIDIPAKTAFYKNKKLMFINIIEII
jgi:hypothetical protein